MNSQKPFCVYAIGQLATDRPIRADEKNYLQHFVRTHRYKRNPDLAAAMDDDRRWGVVLPIGTDGEYFTGGVYEDSSGRLIKDLKCPSIIDGNKPPRTQPSMKCPWEIVDVNKTTLFTISPDTKLDSTWELHEWLYYLIEHFLKPWRYILNGELYYQGVNHMDKISGHVQIINNSGVFIGPQEIEGYVEQEIAELADRGDQAMVEHRGDLEPGEKPDYFLQNISTYE